MKQKNTFPYKKGFFSFCKYNLIIIILLFSQNKSNQKILSEQMCNFLKRIIITRKIFGLHPHR